MKNKIPFIALCMISVILLSCKHTVTKYAVTDDCIGVFMDEVFAFYVRDSVGNDLLDPSNPNGYNIDSIRVYYLLTDGTWHKGQTYYETFSNVINPGDYELVRGKDGYLLDFMLSTLHSIKRENKYPMMCIYWNKKDRDIIRSKLITRKGDPKDSTDAGYCVFITWDTVCYNNKIIAANWKETKKRLLSPPVIIKEGNK